MHIFYCKFNSNLWNELMNEIHVIYMNTAHAQFEKVYLKIDG